MADFAIRTFIPIDGVRSGDQPPDTSHFPPRSCWNWELADKSLDWDLSISPVLCMRLMGIPESRHERILSELKTIIICNSIRKWLLTGLCEEARKMRALSPPEARNEWDWVLWARLCLQTQQDIRYKLKAQLQITSDNQKQFNIIILVDLPPLPSPPPPSPPSLQATSQWIQKYQKY